MRSAIAVFGISIIYSSGCLALDGLTQMDDSELSRINGQALMNLSYTDPSQSNAQMKTQNIGFYKLGLDAIMELNANVKNLQLGCGGDNGAGACDIDISNLALSGKANGVDAQGNPTFNGERASTSAEFKNPFIEFAVKNPNQASTREVKGFRLSAESITGLLTAGTANAKSPIDGIKSLSGYMKIAQTTGMAKTQAAIFGNDANETLTGKLTINTLWNNDRTFVSQPGSSAGLTIPAMNVPFNVPEITVNGKRQTQAVAKNISASVPSIQLDRESGSLQVKLNQNVLWVQGAQFFMDSGSSIDGLKMDITFEQALNMIHNIPLNGTAGYLSLQSQDISWPGANADDVAQKGWWMSFKDPIDIGKLNPTETVDISGVLPQVAQKVSEILNRDPIYIPLGSSIGAAFGLPIYKNVGSLDLSNSGAAALTLRNQILGNQEVKSNCFGGLKFC
ncbi:hypothetical protein [Acinetobacter pragensis]|uniref:hypothetical protein n=1 Tax=Acinetobacter pragensis TaxID=1806892 RepID=UPI00333F919D